MAFTLQDPESGLFWTSGIFGRVQLGPVPNTYTLEGSYIKNTKTGIYVDQRYEILHEGGEPAEFVFGDDGFISSEGKTIGAGQFLILGTGPTSWAKVPVSRAASLLQETLAPEPEPEAEPEPVTEPEAEPVTEPEPAAEPEPVTEPDHE